MVEETTSTQPPMARIDHNHVLYMQAPHNFSSNSADWTWKLWIVDQSMRIALPKKEKLDFVNGVCKKMHKETN